MEINTRLFDVARYDINIVLVDEAMLFHQPSFLGSVSGHIPCGVLSLNIPVDKTILEM